MGNSRRRALSLAISMCLFLRSGEVTSGDSVYGDFISQSLTNSLMLNSAGYMRMSKIPESSCDAQLDEVHTQYGIKTYLEELSKILLRNRPGSLWVNLCPRMLESTNLLSTDRLYSTTFLVDITEALEDE